LPCSIASTRRRRRPTSELCHKGGEGSVESRSRIVVEDRVKGVASRELSGRVVVSPAKRVLDLVLHSFLALLRKSKRTARRQPAVHRIGVSSHHQRFVAAMANRSGPEKTLLVDCTLADWRWEQCAAVGCRERTQWSDPSATCATGCHASYEVPTCRGAGGPHHPCSSVAKRSLADIYSQSFALLTCSRGSYVTLANLIMMN
jgi:hypothetical protein